MSSQPVLVAVMGPTASGKTELAARLADRLEAQLISADAFQAYRGMDIGTAKPDARDRYLLLDLKNPDEGYGVGEFCRLAQAELSRLWEQRRSAVVVGGTGLYIRALFEQYATLNDHPNPLLRQELQNRLAAEGLQSLVEQLRQIAPEEVRRVDIRNPVRVTRALERAIEGNPPMQLQLPPFQRTKLGLFLDSQELGRRIEVRARAMVQNGWVEEVRQLLATGYGPGDPGFRAIGYAELAHCLTQKSDLEEAIATTIAETRRYAKRQRTWLRSEPHLEQLNPADNGVFEDALDIVRRELQ